MDSYKLRANEKSVAAGFKPYCRLARTATFRDGRHDSWSRGALGIVGAGVLGGRIAAEAVRSGIGRVLIWDFDIGAVENQGNQLAWPGCPKVESIVAACDQIRPGVAQGFHHDVRHAGVGAWKECDVMLDCSDDAGLAWALTETSNGTGIPLLRVAVDGSGRAEVGRVLGSHGGGGHACQLCSYSLQDLLGALRRHPCPAESAAATPTLAGGAIASATAGLALLQSQRLLTGNDDHLVLDHEIVIDLSHFQLLAFQLPRCETCLSVHRRWNTIETDLAAAETTLRELFELAEESLSSNKVTLAFYQHPLNTQAFCRCGDVQAAAGADWATPPNCGRCGRPMTWLREMQLDRIGRRIADALGVLDTPLDRLGVPVDGAMFLARSPGRSLRRFLLRRTTTASAPESPRRFRENFGPVRNPQPHANQ